MRWTMKELREGTTDLGDERIGTLVLPASDIEARWAWAGGLFDGEGCISIYDRTTAKGTKYQAVKLEVNMTDQDTVERLAALFQANKPLEIHPRGNRKTQWKLALHKPERVEQVLRWMLPYFSARRADKAWEAIAVLRENRDAGTRRLT